MKLKLDVPLYDLDGETIVRPDKVNSKNTIPALLGAVLADALIADNESKRGTATTRMDNYLLAKRLKLAIKANENTVEVSIEELGRMKDCVADIFAHNKTVQGAVWEALEDSKPVKLVEDKKDG